MTRLKQTLKQTFGKVKAQAFSIVTRRPYGSKLLKLLARSETTTTCAKADSPTSHAAKGQEPSVVPLGAVPSKSFAGLLAHLDTVKASLLGRIEPAIATPSSPPLPRQFLGRESFNERVTFPVRGTLIFTCVSRRVSTRIPPCLSNSRAHSLSLRQGQLFGSWS